MINTKGLGLKQLQLIKRMVCESLIIVSVYDTRDNKTTIQLSDKERENTYESVSPILLQSLLKRKILQMVQWHPCLEIEVELYSVSAEAANKIFGL